MTQQMYPGIANSPQTEIAAAVTAGATSISVQNAADSILPAAPNIATIGTDEGAETIYYAGKSGNTLTGVVRGFDGTAPRAWGVGARVARMFTNYDYEALRGNVGALSESAAIQAAVTTGSNVIETTQATPATVGVTGRTSVNLLGVKGRTTQTQTVDADATKRYLHVIYSVTDGVPVYTSHSVKTGAASYVLSWTSGQWSAFYEITASDPLTNVAAAFPYVDSVQHTQGLSLRATGKNIVSPDITSLNTQASVIRPYKLQLVASDAGRHSYIAVKVKPNTRYTFAINLTGGGGVRCNVNRFPNDGLSANSYGGIMSTLGMNVRTFTTDTDKDTLYVNMYCTAVGSFDYENWTLVLGEADQLPPSFEPRIDQYINAPTLLASNVDGSIADSYDSATKQVFRRWIINERLTVTGVTATLAISALSDTSLIYDKTTGDVYQRVAASPTGKQFTQGGANNRMITFATGNVPAEPYASYVRATPITETLSGDLGGISLPKGATQLELIDGVIVREIVTFGANKRATTALRSAAILGVYKNGDSVEYKTYTSGSQTLPELIDNVDAAATYTVTYRALDRHQYTAGARQAIVTYQSSLGSVVAKNTQNIAELQRKDGVQDFALDYIEAKADNNAIDLNTHAVLTDGAHGATSAATPNRGVQRDSGGRAKFAAPVATDDAARKAEIDALSSATSGFVFGNAETATVMINSAGVDSIAKSGFYYVLTNKVGLPVDANCYVLHTNIHSGATHAVQYCVPNDANRMFMRRKVNSVWQPWVEMWSDNRLRIISDRLEFNTGTEWKAVGTASVYSPTDNVRFTANTEQSVAYTQGGNSSPNANKLVYKFTPACDGEIKISAELRLNSQNSTAYCRALTSKAGRNSESVFVSAKGAEWDLTTPIGTAATTISGNEPVGMSAATVGEASVLTYTAVTGRIQVFAGNTVYIVVSGGSSSTTGIAYLRNLKIMYDQINL